jgi:hypothetical protein
MEDQTKKPRIDGIRYAIDFKAILASLKGIKTPVKPKEKKAKGKKRGPGVTRKAYNFAKQKTRRKMAKRSRRINRLRGV